MYVVKISRAKYEYEIHALVKAFYPEEDVKVLSPESVVKDRAVRETTPRLEIFYGDAHVEIRGETGKREVLSERKEEFGAALYQYFSDLTGRKLPWGNLTGIRPTKIAMTMLEEGKSGQEILRFLRERHFVSEEKALLGLDIARRERAILAPIDYENGYSLYIGIPFCPTTCLYCSFTSFPIVSWRERVGDYLAALERELGCPVVGAAARGGQGLDEVRRALEEAAIHPGPAPERAEAPLSCEGCGECRTAAAMARAGGIAARAATMDPEAAVRRDRRLDRLLTSRGTGIPVMLLLLAGILWLTMVGANVPSELLSGLLMGWQEPLRTAVGALGAPWWLEGALVDGMYRTVAWVVSVMLPPMAIFFPLFTLLEDAGYLPRVAFNLDHFFQKAGAHGRQSLTMCQGLGCNACGVMGCRIIQSPRERLIAILTNAFIPCNGRLPTLTALIAMFFVTGTGLWSSFASAAMLMGTIVLAVAMTLWASKLLSVTVLRGEPSAFSLELPPYRAPQVGQVLIRSILDRTLFVLGRAVAVAAPAGLLIWTAANVIVGGETILLHLAEFLHPLGALMGLDGIILLAFFLGFPANEIVVPCMLMGYLSTGALTDYGSLSQLHGLLTAHGWTAATAICTIIFTLFHFPCGTTCFTIYRETKSVRWTVLAAVLPTAVGMVLCMAIHFIARLF